MVLLASDAIEHIHILSNTHRNSNSMDNERWGNYPLDDVYVFLASDDVGQSHRDHQEASPPWDPAPHFADSV